MEFHFAHLRLRKPIVIVVVGTSNKWQVSSVSKLTPSIEAFSSSTRHSIFIIVYIEFFACLKQIAYNI